MRVLGAGIGRTGTVSLKAALESLGFGPCYHMHEVIGRPEVMQSWLDVAQHGHRDWDRIFAGYSAAVDFPAIGYWRELVAHYPEAKVVLTVRDPEEWFESARQTIFRVPRLLHRPVAGRLYRLGLYRFRDPGPRMFVRMLDALNRDRRDIDFRHDQSIAYYLRHNAAVQAEVPAERLLVYKVGDGWPPLCDFLGVPVPDEPFPRLNSANEFRAGFLDLLKTRTERPAPRHPVARIRR